MNAMVRTPEGTRDRLFAECRERRRVQKALGRLFQHRGYGEVSTPEVEFYDLFTCLGSPLPQEQLLKIIDRSGRIMVMRPDCTAPIARVAASKLKKLPGPQRLYYDQTVFRSGQEHKGGRCEIAQCGVELLGADGAKAEVEVLALAADSLRACGLDQFHIEVGHVGYFHDLVQGAGLSAAEEETARSLIEGKNFAALADFLAPYRSTVAGRALDRLPYLFGGPEVLDEAEELFRESAAIAYLRGLYLELAAAGYGDVFRFDLGLVHQIDYYTGVVFRGYAQGAADAVLSGGRYDRLIAAFGPDTPATGFAVDVDAVAGCLEGIAAPELDTVIHYGAGCLAQALEALSRCPAGTAELSTQESEAESRRMAQAKGAKRLLVVDGDGAREVDL